MLLTFVALMPILAFGRAPTVSQDVAPAVKISVVFVLAYPVKPPATKYV